MAESAIISSNGSSFKDVTIVTNAQCTQLSSKVLPLQDQNSFYSISDLLDHRLWGSGQRSPWVISVT